MIQHKSIHFITLLIFVIGAFILLNKYSEFYEDSLKTFSTIGVFVTCYCLVFAVVELLRTKSVAIQAKYEATKAANRVEQLYAIKDLSTCQSSVEMALGAIEKNEHIPASTLCYITKVYSQVFHLELSSSNSVHRSAKSMIDSYSFASKDMANGKGSNKNKLKKALLEILEHISAEIGKQTKEN